MPPSTLLRLSRNLTGLRTSPATTTSLVSRTRAAAAPIRPFSGHSGRPFAADQDPDRNPHPQRDAQQDREKMAPESNEYAKSGTDDSSAANEEAAFDPNITDPQEAKEKAGEGNEVNPLDQSPANPSLSSGTAEEEGGAKKKLSEGGGGRKGGGESGKGEESV